ncbi:hypothetical protein EYC80_004913 [Monilinia laxa]|uniref:Uncharacterized protein n=1 Tax=Monilinia laxa TaxID=61186 RepID=A0A5N6KI97_MONLA|nr:hypothetical protein EYC80_004913 [Monilinia laxa]
MSSSAGRRSVHSLELAPYIFICRFSVSCEDVVFLGVVHLSGWLRKDLSLAAQNTRRKSMIQQRLNWPGSCTLDFSTLVWSNKSHHAYEAPLTQQSTL